VSAVTDGASRPPVEVSVIIPVFNAEPYLRECLDSVIGQSLGLDRLEVIAVDDGSTDGSAELLDEYASRHRQVTVVHEPNSGGPGRPRNVALDHAQGKYVFFLDADDYLGTDALRRLLEMADRNGSDVVLGKMVGVGGRLVPTRAFARTVDKADLADVYSTLSVLKLFRRTLIEQVGVRFPEGLGGGEDAPITAELYLSAKTISVVADYPCYYYRQRANSQTKRERTESLLDYLERASQHVELLARYRPTGEDRDTLMARHTRDIVRAFNSRWLSLPPLERRRVFESASGLLKKWHTERIQATLRPPRALRAYCLQHDLFSELEDIVRASEAAAFSDPIVDGTRVFARYPHFRDAAGIPDSCFELTNRIVLRRRVERAEIEGTRLRISGHAYLTVVGGRTDIVLRRWPWGPERRFPATPTPTPALRDRNASYPQAGFTAEIDCATAEGGRPLPPGPWQLSLAVGPPQLQVEDPIRLPKRARRALRTAGGRHRRRPAEAHLYLANDGSLRLRVGSGAWLRTASERTLAGGQRLRRRGRRRLSGLRRRVRRWRSAPAFPVPRALRRRA
jgi:glycosyltransferase involved in cell wall biosynthesis